MNERLVVVDDEPHNMDILRIFLKSLHYTVYEAVCGSEALEMIDQVAPDLILLDVMMPDISGFEVCRQLNERPDFDIPIIFLSAKVQKEDVLRGLHVGAHDYLTKPFDLDLLEKKVALALQYRKKLVSLRKDNIRLESMAFKDGLTGLFNRFYLSNVMRKHEEGLIRFQTVMMLDIDRFKEINDVYGHLYGDTVLESVARIISAATDPRTDIVIRYGGDEFLVLFSESGERSGTVAESIRTAISALSFEPEVKSMFSITVSIGLFQVTKEQPLEILLSRADYALFKAKHSGRNQISNE
ncbi:diguanylate cyclase [Paenibacillus eucommiae]|uniref:Diguanylate cyclase (GGDEF)-like protein n=1 Tax=Paenibacillus eucommiae TaxID=1355755 RepID=A0ABS4ITP2_9BACL|nr:diguanylate cyclase [Paenibacillus eucommiae]MBP1990391.1 diguanylate cyclase (GGDEF)-like protein [Paenibacillus eucommiae]